MKLPETLKKLRECRRYSQKTVAARLGCSPSIVSSYETGERLPSLTMLVALADLYGVSTDFLLGRAKAKGPPLDVTGLSERQIEALLVIVAGMKGTDAATVPPAQGVSS